MNSSAPLEWITVVVSILVAAGTVGALVWAVWTYKRDADARLQMLALETLQHYLDLAVANSDLASPDESPPADARKAWFAVYALTTAQTLWLLVGGQPTWQRSIDAIVHRHRAYLQSGMFVCGDFSPEFVAYLRTRVTALRCADPDGGREAAAPDSIG